MKILFLLGGLEKGGAERVVCNLANYLSDIDNEVFLLPTKINHIEYTINNNVNIYELDDRKYNDFLFRNVRIFCNLKKYIYEIKPDVIVSFLQEPTFRILLAKKFFKNIKKIPLIVSLRNDPHKSFNGVKGKILLYLYKYSDGFVFQTREIMNFFKSSIKKKAIIIPNPINPDFLSDNYFGMRPDKIVTVGRLEKQKNYPLLLKSFSKLHEEFNNYHLYIYGDGSLKNDIESLINGYSLNDFVHLEGNVNNLKDRIKDAKLFVMSSDYEGLSNALMEAMALGLPCVSTNSSGGGAASLIDTDVNGILVPINDSFALYEAMKRVISDNKFSKQLSNEALKIREDLNPHNINKIWYDYICFIGEGDRL